MRRLFPLIAVGAAAASACTSPAPPRVVQVAATADAVDAHTVEIRFTAPLDPASVDVSKMNVSAPFVRPVEALPLSGAHADDTLLTLTTGDQKGGLIYTVNVGALRFQGIEKADFAQQIDFEGYGKAQVIITLDARGLIPPDHLDALATIEPMSGEYTDSLRLIPLDKHDLVFSTTVAVRIAPGKTFAARAIGTDGQEAGLLTKFTVTSSSTVKVALAPTLPKIPEFKPPIDDMPGDGLAPIRIIFDDRLAGELLHPQLRSSVDAIGHFDYSMARVDDMTPVPGKGRVYEKIINVAVDPGRKLDGTMPDNLPYVSFLVEGGEDIPQRIATFIVPDETPQVIIVPIGNPMLVPVRFRIDASAAILRPDKTIGKFDGEGLFLTGEFPSAEDALGRLAADAFSGGERTTLELKERADHHGIFEKTIFMMPNRPYGWKVVRCPTGMGCATLNRHFVSSGRAFPTVIKNLVTQNLDAAQNPSTKLIDPAHLDHVMLDGMQIVDYSQATVSTTGHETPGPSIMFKQEIPDIVITVGTTPVKTPIYVVGTWRDINIPMKPSDIVAQGMTINLADYDYDDGTRGKPPIVRDLTLPDDDGSMTGTSTGGMGMMGMMHQPGVPAFSPMDGTVDMAAMPQMTASPHAPLWVGWNEKELYVATDPAHPGLDRFIVISFEAPDSTHPCFWAKAGTCASSTRQVFLAMEGNGMFQGWFKRGTTGANDTPLMAGVRSGQGTALEGTIDLAAAGIGTPGNQVWIAVLSFGTNDGDPLDGSTLTPPGNGDANLDANELMPISLGNVRSQ